MTVTFFSIFLLMIFSKLDLFHRSAAYWWKIKVLPNLYPMSVGSPYPSALNIGIVLYDSVRTSERPELLTASCFITGNSWSRLFYQSGVVPTEKIEEFRASLLELITRYPRGPYDLVPQAVVL